MAAILRDAIYARETLQLLENFHGFSSSKLAKTVQATRVSPLLGDDERAQSIREIDNRAEAVRRIAQDFASLFCSSHSA